MKKIGEYIEWVDASALADWHTKEEIDKLRPTNVESTCCVLSESDEHIVISCAKCEEGGGNGIMIVPKAWIKTRIELFLSEDQIKQQSRNEK